MVTIMEQEEKEVKTVKTKRKYEMDMCTGSLLPKILLFAIPLMASRLLQLMF